MSNAQKKKLKTKNSEIMKLQDLINHRKNIQENINLLDGQDQLFVRDLNHMQDNELQYLTEGDKKRIKAISELISS